MRTLGPARAGAATEWARGTARADHQPQVQRNGNGMTVFNFGLVPTGRPFCSKMMATYSVGDPMVLNQRQGASIISSKARMSAWREETEFALALRGPLGPQTF